jgi:hypothetical protein
MEQNTAKAATTTAVNNAKGMSVVKPSTETAAPPQAAKEEKTKPLTIEERLKKIEQLYKLTERREELVLHLSNLNDFNIDPTVSASVKIDDGNNHRFSIANADSIVEIVVMLKAKIRGFISEIDAQLEF